MLLLVKLVVTQHIGAYEVTLRTKNIYFLDILAEAFTAMLQGVQSTDIAVSW